MTSIGEYYWKVMTQETREKTKQNYHEAQITILLRQKTWILNHAQ